MYDSLNVVWQTPEPTEGRDDYPTNLMDYSETLTTTHYEGGIGQNEERDTPLYPRSRWSLGQVMVSMSVNNLWKTNDKKIRRG